MSKVGVLNTLIGARHLEKTKSPNYYDQNRQNNSKIQCETNEKS